MMIEFDIVLTVAAVGLVWLTTDHRRNAWIVALEFLAAIAASYVLIDLEGYKLVGSCWVFGARALILYAAMRATLKIEGHRMIYVVMLLGMLLNIGAYFEYALKSYGVFDLYYEHAARAVMLLQLIYILGIGYVGSYVGRLRVVGVRWWRAYCLLPERRQVVRGSE